MKRRESYVDQRLKEVYDLKKVFDNVSREDAKYGQLEIMNATLLLIYDSLRCCRMLLSFLLGAFFAHLL